MCPDLGSAKANHGSEDTAQMSGLPLWTNTPKRLQHPGSASMDKHTRVTTLVKQSPQVCKPVGLRVRSVIELIDT